MNIVIPTYPPHFKYNYKFLDSFEKYCKDKNNAKIYFVIDKKHVNSFKYETNNYQILEFENMVKSIEGVNNIDFLFDTKYPHQSIKKLYSSLYLKEDCLVLDSENEFLKNFTIFELENSIVNKHIIYTTKFVSDLANTVKNDCNTVLNFNSKNWYFLRSYWYFRYDICNKLHKYLSNKHKIPFNILKKITFFEYQLYCQFIEKENILPVINCYDLINNNFSKEIENSSTNFEYICSILNDNNISMYQDYLLKNNEQICRLHWMDERYKNQLLLNTNIVLGTFHYKK